MLCQALYFGYRSRNIVNYVVIPLTRLFETKWIESILMITKNSCPSETLQGLLAIIKSTLAHWVLFLCSDITLKFPLLLPLFYHELILLSKKGNQIITQA